MLQTKGSEVGKRSAGLAGLKVSADDSASALSQEGAEGAEDNGGGWAMVTRRKAKAGGIGSSGSPNVIVGEADQ